MLHKKLRALAFGRTAERVAAKYLRQQGLTLVARNFACKQGELDLIMRDADQLIVVEVRFRSSADYGSATDSIDQHKQRKIIAATRAFQLANTFYRNFSVRFDTVGIDGQLCQENIRWEQNAFAPR